MCCYLPVLCFRLTLVWVWTRRAAVRGNETVLLLWTSSTSTDPNDDRPTCEHAAFTETFISPAEDADKQTDMDDITGFHKQPPLPWGSATLSAIPNQLEKQRPAVEDGYENPPTASLHWCRLNNLTQRRTVFIVEEDLSSWKLFRPGRQLHNFKVTLSLRSSFLQSKNRRFLVLFMCRNCCKKQAAHKQHQETRRDINQKIKKAVKKLYLSPHAEVCCGGTHWVCHLRVHMSRK